MGQRSLAGVALSTMLSLGAVPADAKCKVKWRGTKSYLKCGGDIAKVAGKATKVAQENVGQPIGEAVRAVGDGVAHLGDQVGREAGAVGRNLNRAAIEGGRDINRAALHAGKELERMGQKIGDFLKWAVDFDLSCKDPASPPSSVSEPYRRSCLGKLKQFGSSPESVHAGRGRLPHACQMAVT